MTWTNDGPEGPYDDLEELIEDAVFPDWENDEKDSDPYPEEEE